MYARWATRSTSPVASRARPSTSRCPSCSPAQPGVAGRGLSSRAACARCASFGIQGAVTLFELHGETASPEWLAFRDRYEEPPWPCTSPDSGSKPVQALLPLLEPGQDARAYDHATLKLMKQVLGPSGNSTRCL